MHRDSEQPSPRRITIKDIAREAGVSTGLVSMALADHPAVAAETKASIRRVARELDYIPNSIGRALRGRRLGAIAVVIPHSSHHVFSHPYFVEVLDGITEVANQHDFIVILSTAQEEDDGHVAYLKILRGRRADGVIVAAAAIDDRHAEQLVSSGYPVVFLGRDVADRRVVSVVIDDQGGAERIVSHLVETHGLQRIAQITGPLGHRSALDKLTGYQAALTHHGLDSNPRLIVESDYSESGGAEACERLLRSDAPFDGMFAANDQMAFGALQCLARHGIAVPHDVAVVGFDDIPLARVVHPPLTTMHQPMAEIGRAAAHQLIALLAGKQPEVSQVGLPTHLVVRHSCGCSRREPMP